MKIRDNEMKAKLGSCYREYKDWLSSYYDANAFDLDEVNERWQKPDCGNSAFSTTLD